MTWSWVINNRIFIFGWTIPKILLCLLPNVEHCKYYCKYLNIVCRRKMVQSGELWNMNIFYAWEFKCTFEFSEYQKNHLLSFLNPTIKAISASTFNPSLPPPCQNNSSGMSVRVSLTHYSRLTGGLALQFLPWASDFTGYDSANLPTQFPFLFFFLCPCFNSASSQVRACWVHAILLLLYPKECVFHLLSSEKTWPQPFLSITQLP